jgi:7-cyano-7-deazaguanine synthase
MKKVIVALSGGMDSATVLGRLLDEGHEVECFAFTYGSKHNQYENLAAQAVAAYYGAPCRGAIDLSGVTRFFRSDLLKSGGHIPEGHYNDSTMSATVVPARNIIFLSIMAGLAWSHDASEIAIGIHQGDHAIYPDCRAEFYIAMNEAIRLGTDGRVQIVAPFLHTDKSGILDWGLAHGVPYHLTRTCYKDQLLSCGKCGSCCERLEAFAAHGIVDPIRYEKEV